MPLELRERDVWTLGVGTGTEAAQPPKLVLGELVATLCDLVVLSLEKGLRVRLV